MKIHLADYNPEWRRQFDREAAAIRAALGERALRVEHVGSTSIPQLAAKPIIDIVLEVADAAEEDAYAPALQDAGYRLHRREPDWHEHRLFKDRDATVHLHVFSSRCIQIERMLRLRDWLRENPADRQRYEQAKRTLALKEWNRGQDYADAKTGVVEEILRRATGRSRYQP